jgi:type IV pilus assembly protein PilQ
VEATILRAALSEDNALGVDFTVLGGVDFTTLTAPNGLIQGAGGVTNTVNASGAGSLGTGNSFSQGVPNGLKFGFVSNNVSVFVSALEGVTDTTVLANPKVLALNKQKGEVIVGRKDGYITTTTTDTSTVQTVEFLDTGTRLIFRPFIADDGFVRMEIHPEDSSGGLTANNPPLPFKITTEVTSNVMIKDGHTIVIGGLFREESTASKSQIPFLGNLPLAGPLFRQQRDRTTREEIIILLTPHIVKDESVFSESAERMMKDFDKLRAGVRHGMMPWGRERMAESDYDEAVAEMNKPHPDRKRAMWFLDCATNLNPKFLEAMDLKTQLTGRELRSVDNSLIRGFVKQQILADSVYPTTAPAMPSPATKPIAAAPSTQPIAVKPATQPVAVAPSTQPVAAAPTTQSVAEAPAATQPSTQPAQADAKDAKDEPQTTVKVVEIVEKDSPTTAPTTQQTADAKDKDAKDEDSKDFTVTELPLDPVAPNAASGK